MNDIKNLKPQSGKFYQNYFTPKNPTKYKGDLSKIIYRSLWERKVMVYCDLSPNIMEWGSEPIAIPYISPLDNKKHKYYVDFYICEKKEDGLKQYLVEVKPKKDYIKRPEFKGNKTFKKEKLYESQVKTWAVNQVKFKTAAQYAKSIGFEFIIINEDSLFLKNKN